MDLISLYFSNPFSVVNVILAAVNLALALYFTYNLIPRKSREQLTGMDHGINGILLICLVMIFFTYMIPHIGMIKAQFSVAIARTSDPRVILPGMIEMLFPIHFNLFVCSFFLIVWFLLRAFHRLKLEKAEK